VRPGRDADPSLPSSAEVKNRVELYLYSPYGFSWPMKGWNLHTHDNFFFGCYYYAFLIDSDTYEYYLEIELCQVLCCGVWWSYREVISFMSLFMLWAVLGRERRATHILFENTLHYSLLWGLGWQKHRWEDNVTS